MRRQRGSATVEVVLIIPAVIVLIVAIGFFRRGYLTELQALHRAETDAWRIAMSNDRGACGTSARHRFAQVPLGGPGTAARELAAHAMPELSFLYVNGGVRRIEARPIPPPLEPMRLGRWVVARRAHYLPCNEAVGARDTLPGAFDALWTRYVSP